MRREPSPVRESNPVLEHLNKWKKNESKPSQGRIFIVSTGEPNLSEDLIKMINADAKEIFEFMKSEISDDAKKRILDQKYKEIWEKINAILNSDQTWREHQFLYGVKGRPAIFIADSYMQAIVNILATQAQEEMETRYRQGLKRSPQDDLSEKETLGLYVLLQEPVEKIRTMAARANTVFDELKPTGLALLTEEILDNIYNLKKSYEAIHGAGGQHHDEIVTLVGKINNIVNMTNLEPEDRLKLILVELLIKYDANARAYDDKSQSRTAMAKKSVAEHLGRLLPGAQAKKSDSGDSYAGELNNDRTHHHSVRLIGLTLRKAFENEDFRRAYESSVKLKENPLIKRYLEEIKTIKHPVEYGGDLSPRTKNAYQVFQPPSSSQPPLLSPRSTGSSG